MKKTSLIFPLFILFSLSAMSGDLSDNFDSTQNPGSDESAKRLNQDQHFYTLEILEYEIIRDMRDNHEGVKFSGEQMPYLGKFILLESIRNNLEGDEKVFSHIQMALKDKTFPANQKSLLLMVLARSIEMQQKLRILTWDYLEVVIETLSESLILDDLDLKAKELVLLSLARLYLELPEELKKHPMFNLGEIRIQLSNLLERPNLDPKKHFELDLVYHGLICLSLLESSSTTIEDWFQVAQTAHGESKEILDTERAAVLTMALSLRDSLTTVVADGPLLKKYQENSFFQYIKRFNITDPSGLRLNSNFEQKARTIGVETDLFWQRYKNIYGSVLRR